MYKEDFDITEVRRDWTEELKKKEGEWSITPRDVNVTESGGLLCQFPPRWWEKSIKKI